MKRIKNSAQTNAALSIQRELRVPVPMPVVTPPDNSFVRELSPLSSGQNANASCLGFLGRTSRTRQGSGRFFVTGWHTVAIAHNERGTKRRERQRTTPLATLLAKLHLSVLHAWAEASFAGALRQPCSSAHSETPGTLGPFETSSGTTQRRPTPPVPRQRSTIRSCFPP